MEGTIARNGTAHARDRLSFAADDQSSSRPVGQPANPCTLHVRVRSAIFLCAYTHQYVPAVRNIHVAMNDCRLLMITATLLLLLTVVDRSSSYGDSGSGSDDEYDEYDDPYVYVPYRQRRPPPSFNRPRFTGIAVLHLDEGTHYVRRTDRGQAAGDRWWPCPSPHSPL